MTRGKGRAGRIGVYALLAGFSMLFMLPTLWMILTSGKSLQQIYSLHASFLPIPAHFGENYAYVIKSYKYFSYFGNTLFVALVATLGRVLSSAMAGYAFARIDFPFRRALFAVALGTMMIPSQVTQIPTYLLYSKLRWLDSYLPLTVPAFFGSAFSIFLMRQFFLSVPDEVADAAKIDGCGAWGAVCADHAAAGQGGRDDHRAVRLSGSLGRFSGAAAVIWTPRANTRLACF